MMPIRAFCSSLGGGDPGNEYTLIDMRLIGPILVKLRMPSTLGFRCLETRKLRRGYSLQNSRAQPVSRHVLYTMSRNHKRKQSRELGFYKCEAGRLRKGNANQFRDRR